MPRGFLLDTNVISELRKGARTHPRVRAWADGVAPAACFLSRVVLAEIRFGIERVTDPGFRAELEAWLRDGVRTWFNTRILEADEDVLTAWRLLAWEGQKSGWTCPQPDGLIAATARVHDLAVATRNVGDFARTGVAVVDPWGE